MPVMPAEPGVNLGTYPLSMYGVIGKQAPPLVQTRTVRDLRHRVDAGNLRTL